MGMYSDIHFEPNQPRLFTSNDLSPREFHIGFPYELENMTTEQVMACDNHTFDLWEEMVKTGVKITEGLCVGILARSAESELLRFAEEVAKYCREKRMMSIAVYSALTKVYAYCDF